MVYSPMINFKKEGYICGQPPEILKIVEKDPVINYFKAELRNVFNENFTAVKKYWDRFSEIIQFHKEDISFDEKSIKENVKCDLFRQLCSRYSAEMEIIDTVIDEQSLGIFHLTLKRFKFMVEKAIKTKQGVLGATMPQ